MDILKYTPFSAFGNEHHTMRNSIATSLILAMLFVSGCDSNDSKIPVPVYETPTPAATLTADQAKAVDEEYRAVATEAARKLGDVYSQIEAMQTPTP
ncbi:MAG: hypothetical protein NUV65_02245 [Candidatus Roizmanbacteria bacterium]|nr:hypothetical protein [Candidatus Roizmanbacteria bacterium]